MNIMELGAIGELVGGVAVVASLIYVGLQVRQSNQINRAESVRSFVRDYNTFLYKLEEKTDIWRRGTVDFEGLSKDDQSRLHYLLLSHFMLGLGDSIATPDRSDQFASFIDTSVAFMAHTPGLSQWWNKWKRTVGGQDATKSYVAHIERMSPPDLLEALPWFEPDDSEHQGA